MEIKEYAFEQLSDARERIRKIHRKSALLLPALVLLVGLKYYATFKYGPRACRHIADLLHLEIRNTPKELSYYLNGYSSPININKVERLD